MEDEKRIDKWEKGYRKAGRFWLEMDLTGEKTVDNGWKDRQRRGMTGKKYRFILALALAVFLTACTTVSGQEERGLSHAGSNAYESVEGTQIRMITEDTEVVITLNDSRAAADLVVMLPLELTLIERNGFAKGMTLPKHLSSMEATTRDYRIGDFGYWADGPDLAIFYDDIYEQTIVPVIPMGRARTGAETIRDASGKVRLELILE